MCNGQQEYQDENGQSSCKKCKEPAYVPNKDRTGCDCNTTGGGYIEYPPYIEKGGERCREQGV